MKEGISVGSVSFSVVAAAVLDESIYHLKMALRVKFFTGNRIYMMKMEGQLTRHPVTPRHWGFSPRFYLFIIIRAGWTRKIVSYSSRSVPSSIWLPFRFNSIPFCGHFDPICFEIFAMLNWFVSVQLRPFCLDLNETCWKFSFELIHLAVFCTNLNPNHFRLFYFWYFWANLNFDLNQSLNLRPFCIDLNETFWKFQFELIHLAVFFLHWFEPKSFQTFLFLVFLGQFEFWP